MSTQALHHLIGAALVDQAFQRDLLDGRRAAVIESYDLSPDERRVILGIRSSTLQEFALALDRWLDLQMTTGAASTQDSCPLI